MADHDQRIVMVRKDQHLAARRLARGIVELCLAPVVGIASLWSWFNSDMVVAALGSVVCLGAGIVHIVGGLRGLRGARRELAQIEAVQLPEARLIER